MSKKAEIEKIKLYYSDMSLMELKQRIDDYIKKGYTKFDVDVERGYYDEITKINLEVFK